MAFVGRDLLFPQEPQRSAAGSRQEPKKASRTEGMPKWRHWNFIPATTFELIDELGEREFLTCNHSSRT
jgi:hypothetical protein